MANIPAPPSPGATPISEAASPGKAAKGGWLRRGKSSQEAFARGLVTPIFILDVCRGISSVYFYVLLQISRQQRAQIKRQQQRCFQ